MPAKPRIPAKRDRFSELEDHIAQIDEALTKGRTVIDKNGEAYETFPSPSEVASLLRERRMTLNAIDSLIIVEGDTVADEVKAKRDARRARLAKKVQ